MVWWAATHAYNIRGAEANDLVGKMISFYLFLNLLFRPLRVIADKFNVLQMGMIASERVFKALDNEDYIKEEGSYAPDRIKGNIEFRNVCSGMSGLPISMNVMCLKTFLLPWPRAKRLPL